MAEPELDLNAGALAPVGDEVTLSTADVTVDGTIPAELNGTLVRNGPNPFTGRFEGDGMLSWWIGPAMVHGIAFESGRVAWYRNRWVRTGWWDRHHQPAAHPDPIRDTNANVNVVSHAGRVLALGEGGHPFEISATLDTVGPVTYGGALPGGMTAHPKIDPVTGEMVFFRAGWEPPYLRYGVLDPAGRLTTIQEIELPGPVMMHDLAITEHHSVVLDLNVAYDLSVLASGAAMPLRWDDGHRPRLGAIPRAGGPVAWYDIEPCFIQHVVNAYEHAGRIVLEAVRYPDFLRFDDERGAFAPNPLGTLWRFTIDTVTGATTETALDDRAIELPRIDERRTGRRHRYLYAVEQPSDTEMRGLVKYDGRDGGCRHVPIPPGDQNSEPVFVPRSAATSADDDGWVITCVYRHQTHTTDVVVLDACDLDPVATVHLPRPVPAGFHGAWLPAEQR